MSHVQGHFRNVDGKLIWVADHEREGAPGVHMHSIFDLSGHDPEPAEAPAPKAPEPAKVSTPKVDAEVAASGTDLGGGLAAPETKGELTKDHFKDVGKKIGGAAKDMAALKAKYYKQKLAITLDDLESMESESPELAQQLMTKEQQLGTKTEFIAQMKNQGASAGCAYMAGRLYTAMGEPIDTPAGRKAFALGLKRVQEAISTWKTPEDAVEGMSCLSDEIRGFWMFPEDAATRLKLIEARDAAKLKSSHALFNGTKEEKAAAGKAYSDAYAAVQTFSKEARKKAEGSPDNPVYNLLALGQGFKKSLTDESRVKDIVKKGLTIEKTVGWEFAEKKAGEDGAPKEKQKKPWHGWTKPESEVIEKVGSVASGIFVASTLTETFGIKGVEYGNWMDKDSSQHHTQACGEALTDLAFVLGMDPKEVSLNGRLSIAFGARGKGGAKAHYELDKKAINMTKMKGGGSLAHEWGHAMDNIMAMVSTGGKSHHLAMVSENNGVPPGTEMHPEVIAAFKGVHDAIHDGNFQLMAEKQFLPDPGASKKQLTNQGKQMLEAAGGDPQVALDLYATKISYMKLYKPKKHATMLKNAAQLFADASGKPVSIKTPVGKPTSHFVATGNHMGEYWGRKPELLARAWESFVMDKMIEKGMKNTYLVSGVAKENAEAYGKMLQVLEPIGGKTSIYPLDDERAKINAAFEKLVSAMNTHKMFAKAVVMLKSGLFDQENR